jgi:peptidoglycan LD-endopeptidase CwlK
VTLRWGGDWSMDFEVRDNQFDDLVHFEIVGE